MKLETRINIEKQIVKCLIKSLINKGFKLSVWDGERTVVKKSNDVNDLIKNIQQTDEDSITVWGANGEKLGYVYLVYGNDGYDVIADYTCELEDSGYLSEVLKLCDELERKHS